MQEGGRGGSDALRPLGSLAAGRPGGPPVTRHGNNGRWSFVVGRELT